MINTTTKWLALPLLALGSATLAFNSSTALAATIHVPADQPTIQGAVNAASPGDTIQVAAGIYAENVTIPVANLILDGAQAGNGVSGRTFGGATESTLVGQFDIQGAGVTIDGFSLTHSVPAFAAFGIVVHSTGNSAAIMNNIIDTVVTPDTGVNGTAQAIYLQGGPDGVEILGNIMRNIVSVRSAKGVLIGDNGDANPSLNTTIQGNSISNVTSTTRGAYGVSVGNVIGVAGLKIVDNTIDHLNGGGWVHAIGLEGDTPGVLVVGNEISNLISSSPDKIAVWFESNPSFSSGHVNENNFDVTPAAFGIAVQSTLTGSPVDGTCNWWGAPNGPGPVGSGAQVSPKVTYTPWLGLPAPGGVCGTIVKNKNQCKNGGWQTVFRADGTSFKNQGDCIQYVNTGK